MPRALAVRYLDVPDAGRAAYLARLGERVASARAAGFHLWSFEAAARAGRFVEFVETAGPEALATALLQDELFAETLDFRYPPGGAPPGAWERFTGVADR